MSEQYRHLGPQWGEEVATPADAQSGILGDVFFTTSDHKVRFTSSPGKSIIFELNDAAETAVLIQGEETDAFKDMITDSAGMEAYVTSVSDTDTVLGAQTNAILLAMIAASHTNTDTGTSNLTFEINSGGFKATLDTANVIEDFILDLNKIFRHIEAVIPVQDHQTIMFSAEDETDPSQTNNFFPFTITATSFSGVNDPFKAYNDSNLDSNDCWQSNADPAGVDQILALDFGFGNSKLIDQYRFLSRNVGGQQNEPTDWTFEGSNDSSPNINDDGPWTVLDTRTGEPDLGQNTLSALFITSPVNTVAFRHYRFKCTESGGNRVAIANLQLFNSNSVLATQNSIFQSTNILNPVPHVYDLAQDKIFSLLDGVEVT